MIHFFKKFVKIHLNVQKAGDNVSVSLHWRLLLMFIVMATGYPLLLLLYLESALIVVKRFIVLINADQEGISCNCMERHAEELI